MKRTPRAYWSGDLIALTVPALLTGQPRHPYELQRLMRERHTDFAVGKVAISLALASRRVASAGHCGAGG